MANSISYREISKQFTAKAGVVTALENFNFEIDAQEFIVIVGPSGCGKTTLLSLTAGLLSASGGAILLDDHPVIGPGPDRAVVFQDFSLFPWKTVEENISFGLRINGIAAQERQQLMTRAIEMIGLVGFEKHFPDQLSGGMQQRVAIARAFVLRPKVLLMDEPFAALDAMNRTLMQEELVRIWSEDKPTVLFITHSVEEAIYLADRVLVMTRRPGSIKELVNVHDFCGVGGHWRHGSLDGAMARKEFQELRRQIWNSVKEEIGGQ
ncbi:MAG TPA: ABC transporter ATP-binding protein [Sneathiellales bacterium]|jgi:NitT/TauT family transport system ATP-binding protein|nr:ABC transporter ATP-binding protein [Sneathiellales bacterium]